MAKILVVDDDRAMTSLLKTLLEMESPEFEVTTAPMGTQAIDMAHANPPDLIMVDYNLKDMQGTELISYFRQQAEFARTPILMASGMNVEQEAYSAGANLFLLKPFEPSQIASTLLNLIGQ